MSNTNKRAPKAGVASSLRDRADATKASAKRVVRKDLADQPSQESLPSGSPVDQATGGFTGYGEPRHAQAQGPDEKKDRGGAGDRRQPSGETDMGRHETFENAIPVAGELLAGTMLGRARSAIMPAAEPDPAFSMTRENSTTTSTGRTEPSAMSVPDLANACVEQVERLNHWDANPGSLSEEEGDREMDRWGAVFRRAIDEPSAGSRDLAGKAYLMLADLERFHPGGENGTDDKRLMRVILREAIAMGGLAGNQIHPMHSEKSAVSLPAEADAEIVVLAAAFCEAYAKNGRMDR